MSIKSQNNEYKNKDTVIQYMVSTAGGISMGWVWVPPSPLRRFARGSYPYSVSFFETPAPLIKTDATHGATPPPKNKAPHTEK